MKRQEIGNPFEFVAVAGQRARQLLGGCTPRIDQPGKLVKIAQEEVAQGVIQKVDETQDAR